MQADAPSVPRELFTLAYGQLRRIAHGKRRSAGAPITLDTTALVHEVWLKLNALETPQPIAREHFLSIAARAMRQVLVDHARGKGRLKRGGDCIVTALDERDGVDPGIVDFVALNAALERLEAVDARAARVVEWHVFGGLGMEEIAALQGLTERTVFRDWRRARAFLVHELDLPSPAT